MSCSRARHATARTFKHIWISDEALSHAFNRYLRVSHVHRRHGSNVPGPLEARRRLAKRRMGMESVAYNVPPPLPDLRALFGIRFAKPPPDFEMGRRWEPPTQHQLDRRNDSTQKKRKAVTWAEEESLWSFFSPPIDPVVVSQRSFEALLNAIQSKDQLAKQDLRDVLAFLDSPQNQPEARLTLRLVQWLGAHEAVAPEVWHDVAASTKLRARNMEINVDEMLSVLSYLLDDPFSGRAWIPAFIQLPEDYHTVYCELAADTLRRHPEKDEAATRISLWLDHIVPAVYSDRRSHQHTQLFEFLAEHFDPSDFPVHFGRMPRTTLCRILLKHWAPRYTLSNIQHKERLWLTLFDNFTKHLTGYTNYCPNDVIAHLARWKVPYVKLLHEIFSIYLATQPTTTVKNLAFNLLKRSPAPFVPRDLGVKLVDRFLKEGRPSDAARIFLAVPGIPLSAYPELPVMAVQEDRVHASLILAMLHRVCAEDLVTKEHRFRHTNPLRTKQIDIIHQTAAAWAKSTHINARTAFRRVWECYRFLQDRGARLSPLMSQALAEAGIVRAIKENGRLSIEQAHYVINVVERIEGRKKAAKLDQAVSDYWENSSAKVASTRAVAYTQQPKYTRHARHIWSHQSIRQRLPPKTYYRHMMLRDLNAGRRTGRNTSPHASTLKHAMSPNALTFEHATLESAGTDQYTPFLG